MLKRVPIRSFVPVALGAMLGYAAASGDWSAVDRPVSARAPEAGSDQLPRSACCPDGSGRDTLLALAAPERAAAQAPAGGKKPNILVIFGDDIGQTNVSAYSMGLMGYRTPNIDRIAREGMIFTDYYAEQSCTAGRSSFITGQCTFRTGLSKVGVPAAPVGPAEGGPDDRRAAQAARLRDRPVRQEPPRRPERVPAHRPRLRRVLRQPLPPERRGGARAADIPARPRVQADVRPPRGAPVQGHGPGRPDRRPPVRARRQADIEDTGPLTKKRMETIDDETSDAAIDYIKRQATAGKPFFCWYNSTRMHLRTHVAAERRSPPGLTARTEYADGMVEHDGHVGKLLKAIDDLGIADNTIVLYTTDNGPHMNTWPDGAMTPFRSEKNTNWEGAFRVPCMIRWPGKIKAGSVSNEIVSGHDWLPTFLAAAGEPDIKEKLSKGHEAAGKTFKVHLDGYNQLPYLTGQVEKSPRRGFFYFNDDGDLVALRFENWKVVFMEQRAAGHLAGLGRAVHPAPAAQALRPPGRPVRAGRHHLQHLLRLVHLAAVPDLRRPGGDGRVPGHVQGVPAPPAGRELHHRPGDGEDEAESRRQLRDRIGAMK